jgi:hypothetical protein
MQVQNLAFALHSFYLQYRGTFLFVWLLIMAVFAFFGTTGVVLADGPGTGGGACSGC